MGFSLHIHNNRHYLKQSKSFFILNGTHPSLKIYRVFKFMSNNMSPVQNLTYYYPTGQRAASAVTVVQKPPIPWWALVWVAIGASIALLIGFALLSWGLSRRHQMQRVNTNQGHHVSLKPPPPLKVTKKMDPKLGSKRNEEKNFIWNHYNIQRRAALHALLSHNIQECLTKHCNQAELTLLHIDLDCNLIYMWVRCNGWLDVYQSTFTWAGIKYRSGKFKMNENDPLPCGRELMACSRKHFSSGYFVMSVFTSSLRVENSESIHQQVKTMYRTVDHPQQSESKAHRILS